MPLTEDIARITRDRGAAQPRWMAHGHQPEIHRAALALWPPAGVPPPMKPGHRVWRVSRWLVANGYPLASPSAIRRYINRCIRKAAQMGVDAGAVASVSSGEKEAPMLAPNWPLPNNAQQILETILAHGGVTYTNAEGNEVAGSPLKPGPVLPCSPNDMLALAMNRLLGNPAVVQLGPVMCVSRRGRWYATHGTVAEFDESRADDISCLQSWARGETELDIDEMIAEVEAHLGEVVLTRGEALILLLQKGVITPAEARRNV